MSASNMEESKVKLRNDRKQRLEKTTLAILQGLVGGNDMLTNSNSTIVDISLELAKEFIKQIDEEKYI